MKLLKSHEMINIDKETINSIGIPSHVLMENAALAILKTIKLEFPSVKKVLVLTGKGNNGGDGLALVRHLLLRNYHVDYVLCMGEELKGDAELQYKILKNLGKEAKEEVNFSEYDLIVDAIFGTGFEPPVKGQVEKWINKVNQTDIPILSVDIPSGLSADTPEIFEPHVKSSVTVTFAFPKICHIFYPSAKSCGKVFVANISIPQHLASHIKRELITHIEIPQRSPQVHKGIMGHTFLVGSSIGKTGALILSAKAATRTGSGLVTVGVPQNLNSVFEISLTEEMSIPLEGQDRLSYKCVDKILSMQDKFSALGVGMGMDRYKEGQEIVKALIEDWEKPLLLDADALNNLADSRALGILTKRKIPAVLTPHVGEFVRLSGYEKEEILKNPIDLASEFSQKYNCYVVLKFSRTVIATPSGKTYISTYGTPAMAKAGVGDVLSGILTSWLGRDMTTEYALKLGVVLHGISGQIAERLKHTEAVRASDLVENIPNAYNSIQSGAYSSPIYFVD